ncbi:MAG: tetratricopeptide repeat protein [Chloroflexota bacterium]|nr:MAG: tetratricopeptide repeat protein [Chloroflexota bacterium]
MQSRLGSFCEKILEAGWLAAVVVVPLFFDVFSSRVFEPDKLSLLRAIVLLMAAAWLIRFLESTSSGAGDLRSRLRALVLESPINLGAALMLGAYVLATILSIAPVFSFWGSYQRLQGLLSVLAYIGIFFFASQFLVRREQVERLITTILLTSLPIALYGILQSLGRDPLPWSGDVVFRVTGTMGNAIFLAAYLIMVVPLTLGRLVSSVGATKSTTPANALSFLRPGFYGLLLLLQLTTTVLTQSRGPWLGLIAGLAVFVLLALLRERRVQQFWISVAVLLAGLAFIAVLNVPSSPLAGLKTTSPYLERLGSIAETDSATGKVRLLIWTGDGVGSGALGLITADPFRTIFGYGPETMQIAYGKYYPPELAHVEARNASPDRSHNDYLDSVVTTGLIGLLAQLFVLGAFAVIAVRSVWRAEDFGQRLLLLSLLAAVVAHSVEVLVGIAIAATRTYFWLDLAIVAAIAVGRLQWSPLKAPRATPASPVAASAQPRTRRIRAAERGRAVERPQRQRRSSSDTTGWTGALPIAVYLAVTIVLALWIVPFGGGRGLQPVVLVVGTFVWIALGIFVGAWQLNASAVNRASIRRPNYLILYGLIMLIASFSIVFYLLSPITADVYFKKAQALDEGGRKQQSLPEYLGAINWTSYMDYYYVFLGRLMLETAGAAPDKPETRQAASIGDLAALRFDQLGREDLAQASLVVLTTARDLSPRNADNTVNLGRLYKTWAEMTADPAKKKERMDLANSYFEQATQLSPNIAYLYVEWAGLDRMQGLNDQAAQKLQQAIQLDDKYADAWVQMAELARTAKNLPQATEYYSKAIGLNPSSVPAHAGLGMVYYQQGQLNQAVDAMLQAARYAPTDATIHRNLALFYRDLRINDKAIAETQLALRYAPASQQAELKSLLDDLQKNKG